MAVQMARPMCTHGPTLASVTDLRQLRNESVTRYVHGLGGCAPQLPQTNVRSPGRMASHGSRRARRPRRPGAQPQGHHRPAPAERAHLHHRALGLREVEPRLRHDLRRGPAPLRRVALGLRAPVPADDGEARRRLDRRPLARRSRSTRRRPRATRARPSARSPRSTTTCACSTRASGGRTARSAAGRSPGSRSTRSSSRSSRCPRGRASRSTRRSSATARASTATSSRSSATRASRASRSTASSTCSRRRRRSTRSSSTRSRSSSTGSC